VQRSRRARTRMRLAIGLHLWTGPHPPCRFRVTTIRAARPRRRADQADRCRLSLAGPAWRAARDGQLRGRCGVCRPPMNRTLALPQEAKVPGVSLPGGRLSNTRGWTRQADGGNHDGCRCDAHCCRHFRPGTSGNPLYDGGGLVYLGFPLNAGGQLVSIQRTSKSSSGSAARGESRRPLFQPAMITDNPAPSLQTRRRQRPNSALFPLGAEHPVHGSAAVPRPPRRSSRWWWRGSRAR
jgi:hypothetical protein